MSNNNINTSPLPSYYTANYAGNTQSQPVEGTAIQSPTSSIDSILANPTARKELELVLLEDLISGSGAASTSSAGSNNFTTSPELLAMLEQELNPASSSSNGSEQLYNNGYKTGYQSGQQNTMALLDSILGENPGSTGGVGQNQNTSPNASQFTNTATQLPGFNQYAQANGGYTLTNPTSENTAAVNSGSDLTLTGDPHVNGSFNGTHLTQSDLMSSHDDLFDDNADMNGGFQIGNTVGNSTSDGKTYTQSFNATVQGHKVEVDQNAGGNPTVTVDGKQLSAGQTSGPVTVNQDGSVTISGYNDANGTSVTAKITEDSSGQGLNLDLSNFQNVNNAGGAIIDQAQH
jgi:hypothetical protein